MNYSLLLLSFLFLLRISAGAQPVASTTTGGRPLVFLHRVIVKFRPEASANPSGALSPVAMQYGISSIASWLDPRLLPQTSATHKPASQADRESIVTNRALARIMMVEYSADDDPASVAARLSTLPGVEYAEPVFRRYLDYLPNDPLLNQQWYLYQIRALEAWDLIQASPDIIIAILDTGIDLGHPDLKDAIWANQGEAGFDVQGHDRRSNGIDDDGNGIVDDWIGYDFGGKDGYSPDNLPQAAYFHGTHVAGLAAATGDNRTGMAGVGYGARLMAVKISDDEDNNPLLTGGFNGIKYAADMGARIINCSWGGPGYSHAEQELMDYATQKGSLIVASAGNEGGNIPDYPASYRNVLSVASVLGNDQRSSFSNYNTGIGISAPGNDILSTMPLDVMPSGYGREQGTSMSAPIVSGAAALVATKFPSLSPVQLSAVLRASADNIDSVNPQFRFLLGSGRLNLQRALTVGPDAVSARVIDYQIIEEKADSLIEPGESIEIRLDVENLLAPSSALQGELSSTDTTVQIVTPTENFGPMQTLEVRQSSPGNFRFIAPNTRTIDYPLPLRLILRDGERVVAVQSIDLFVNPNYATTAHNRIAATFTGYGRIGYNDSPNNRQGVGYQFDSSSSLLAEGGLLIGVASNRLFDVVRTVDADRSHGLHTIEPYRVSFSVADNAQIGSARFTDSATGAVSNRIHTDIRLKTYEFTGSDQGNQVVLFYRIANNNPTRLDNIFCALYLDWDVGPAGANNQVSLDPEHRLGYVRNVKTDTLPFAGAMLLSEQPMNFTALENSGPPLKDGFSLGEKWNAISGGLQREKSAVGDCSMIIGAGPISLDPGADTVVAFSLMAGRNLEELQRSAGRAQALYRQLGETPGGPVALPRDLALLVTGPNPFSGRTSLQFQMPRAGFATVDVYNSVGQRVAELAAGTYTKGIYSVDFQPDSEANGAYFVRLTALNQTLLRKLTYLKTY